MGVTFGFELLIIGSAILIGGAIGIAVESWQIGVAVSSVLALGYILLGRKYLRRSLAVVTTSTNVDRLVGREALVTKAISANAAGQVEIDGEVWRAQAMSDIAEGTRVSVSSVEGVTLNVVSTLAPKPKKRKASTKKATRKMVVKGTKKQSSNIK